MVALIIAQFAKIWNRLRSHRSLPFLSFRQFGQSSRPFLCFLSFRSSTLSPSQLRAIVNDIPSSEKTAGRLFLWIASPPSDQELSETRASRPFGTKPLGKRLVECQAVGSPDGTEIPDPARNDMQD